MKLLRYGLPGHEQPGLLDADGTIRDLSRVVPDITGAQLAPDALARLAAIDPATLPAVTGSPRIGPPVSGIGKLIGIGLNYADHAAEANMQVPPEPIFFLKASTCICGPNDAVVLPPGSTRLDWEVELGVVIGTVARHVTEAQAMDHVAGYCVVNDVSERSWQLERAGQWTKGKSYDTFGPVGPWLVTKDEVPDPQNLALWLEVDGKRYQDGSTRTMVYQVPFLVSYVSQFMTLMPGDIITTGTPPGVGSGQKPPVFLREGNVMRLGIQGLGEQRQQVVARG